MAGIKELGIAVAFLESTSAGDFETIFSQEDRDTFCRWLMKEWRDEWDKEMTDHYIMLISEKIKELKGE
ncbi:MAG: hypothetical protein ACRCVU_20300 [Flavobacterium sp.]